VAISVFSKFRKALQIDRARRDSKQTPDTFERAVRVEATSSQQQQRCQSSTYGCLHNSWARVLAKQPLTQSLSVHPVTLQHEENTLEPIENASELKVETS
jgi:hypothetical protein